MTQKIEDADVLEAFVTVAQKHIDVVTAIYHRGFPSDVVGGAGLLPGGKAGLLELVRIADVSRKAIVRVKGRVATMLKGAGEDSLAIDIDVFVDRIANGAAWVRQDENSPVAVVFEPLAGCDGTDLAAAQRMWQRLKSGLLNAAAELRTATPDPRRKRPWPRNRQ